MFFQEMAYNCLRIKKVQFFGTVFLCGVDPPVLKLQRFDNEHSLYVSLVDPARSPVNTPPATSLADMVSQKSEKKSGLKLIFLCVLQSDLERCDETKNGEHSIASSILTNPSSPETSSEIKSLLSRKEELTRTHQVRSGTDIRRR
jgi:hypothetical protein